MSNCYKFSVQTKLDRTYLRRTSRLGVFKSYDYFVITMVVSVRASWTGEAGTIHIVFSIGIAPLIYGVVLKLVIGERLEVRVMRHNFPPEVTGEMRASPA